MSTKNASILLVEDDELLSQMYKTKLSHDGFKVKTALDGEVGYAEIEKGSFDVVLLDVIMPKLDGFGVLEKMKTNDKTKEVPVIMLTNLGQDEDIEKGKSLGAFDYLIKANLTPQQVSDKIKDVLKKIDKEA